MRFGCCLYLLITLCSSTYGQSIQEKAKPTESLGWIKRDSYLVLAAENTALQKFLAGKRGQRDYGMHLFVDGNAFVSEAKFAIDDVKWEQLQKDLLSIQDSHVIKNETKNKSIFIHPKYHSVSAKTSRKRNVFHWALEGFVRQRVRLESVTMSPSFSSGGKSLWDEIKAIGESTISVDKTIDEESVGNEYVEVYPVRTFLSRLETDDADCVVVVKQKFSDEFDGRLPRAVTTSMSVFSRKLGLESRRKVKFVISTGLNGKKSMEWFLEKGASEMTKLMAFETWTVIARYE